MKYRRRTQRRAKQKTISRTMITKKRAIFLVNLRSTSIFSLYSKVQESYLPDLPVISFGIACSLKCENSSREVKITQRNNLAGQIPADFFNGVAISISRAV